MQTTPIIMKASNNVFWKWLTGLTVAGIATYLGVNYLKSKSLPPITEVIDDLNEETENPGDFEKYYWQWKVMTDPKYRDEIAEFMTVEDVVYISAVRQLGLRKWYENGDLTSISIRKQFDVEVRLFERIIKGSPDWMEGTRVAAQERGVSVAEMLRINAAYSAINKYAKRYKIAGASQSNNQQQGGQSGFSGYLVSTL